MKANEMCNLVTRKIAIYSRCNFCLYGMNYIAHDSGSLTCLFKTVYSVFDNGVHLNDVFVHVHTGVLGELRLIHKFKTLRSSPRVLVLVSSTHVPTLKLLRAMNILFIVSLRDSLNNIGILLQDSSIVRYMSPDLQAVINTIKPTKELDTLDDIQYLTPMETEVILDLLQGMSPLQVARKWFISVKTVSVHKLNALKKIELRGLNQFFT